ncbi:MAG: hypothetical protein ACFB0C_05730, partial [Leptolyngbyaceae cyanobacterium]
MVASLRRLIAAMIAAMICCGWLFTGSVAWAGPLPLQVNTTADTGEGSLRWAMTEANAASDADVIDLSGIQGEIILQTPFPPITQPLTLLGNGITINGNDHHRILQIDRGAVTLEDLTLTHGLAQGADGVNGGGGSAGMGGGLWVNAGTIRLNRVKFLENQAIGGQGSLRSPVQVSLLSDRVRLKGNRGAVVGVDGINLADLDSADTDSIETDNADPADPALLETPRLKIDINRSRENIKANRGAISGVSGVGVNGIGTIAFGGGGGFGGFGNAGNGGNGGNAGANGGNGGNGGDGGDGGGGVVGGGGRWGDQGSIGSGTCGR